MNNVFIILGNTLMFIIAVFSFSSAVYIINNILKSKELRDMRNIKKSLENNTYLIDNSTFLSKKNFIYEYQNSGNSTILEKIEIDNSYLSDNMTLFIPKKVKGCVL